LGSTHARETETTYALQMRETDMRHEVATYDWLRDLAHDFDATIIAGAVAPPMNGRMWVADRALDELLLPDGQACMVTMLIARGGPPQHHIALGRGMLDADGRQRLSELASKASAAIYEGRLALLTPADWISLHSSSESGMSSLADAPAANSVDIDSRGSEVGGAYDDQLIQRAQALGWPANLRNGQWLFLDEQPLYHILAKENVGRDAMLVVARHADTH
jgi:hypothetical protein